MSFTEAMFEHGRNLVAEHIAHTKNKFCFEEKYYNQINLNFCGRSELNTREEYPVFLFSSFLWVIYKIYDILMLARPFIDVYTAV